VAWGEEHSRVMEHDYATQKFKRPKAPDSRQAASGKSNGESERSTEKMGKYEKFGSKKKDKAEAVNHLHSWP